jgi:hypothetical protein
MGARPQISVRAFPVALRDGGQKAWAARMGGGFEEEMAWYRKVEWTLRQATAATREYCKVLDRRRHIDVVG